MKFQKSLLPMVILLTAFPLLAQERSVDLNGFVSFIEVGDEANSVLDVDNDIGFTVGLNFFFGDRVSLDFTAGIFEPEASIDFPTATLSRGIKSHQVISAATVGKVKFIPLTAALQYHFKPESRFDPYIGAGVEYILLGEFDSNDVDFEEINFDDDLGVMVNAGVSIDLGRSFALILDAKYVPFDDGVKTSGPTPIELEIHPAILSAGISFQF